MIIENAESILNNKHNKGKKNLWRGWVFMCVLLQKQAVSDTFSAPLIQSPMFEQQSIAVAKAEPTFLARVMFYFGLAILTSAAGTYVGFRYFAPIFIATPFLIWVLFAAELILVFTARIWSTKRPLNYMLFTAFAFITGITLVPLLASVIVEFGGIDIILKALLATTLMFTGTAVFGWVTHKDLSGMRGFLWVSLIGMIIVSLIGIFIPWNNTFELVFSGFGVIVFSAYTMYDIQNLKIYPSDRAMDAALKLYLDIFNLFIYILRLISGMNRN
jgi:modulator of FtsH protease